MLSRAVEEEPIGGDSVSAKVGVWIAVAILAVGGLVAAGFVYVPVMLDWAKNQLALEQQRQELAAGWQPFAADASPDIIFPASIGAYTRELHDGQAGVPELKLDLGGRHAVYRSGPSRIELNVYAVTPLEAEAVLNRVKGAYDEDKSAYRRWTKIGTEPNFTRVALSTSKLAQNELWFNKGWLLLFRTTDGTDCEPFAMAYFKVRAGGAAAPAGT